MRAGSRWGTRLVTVGGILMVVAMFGPWVRSGSNRRNSFELVELIDRLGFAPHGPVAVALKSWPLAPLAVVVTVVLTIWIGSRVIGVLAVAVGLTIGAVGLAVRLAPESTLIGSGWGATLAVVGGTVMATGGALSAATSRRSVPPQPAGLQDLA